MIAQFKKMTQWPAVALALLLALGLVTLTDAQANKETAEQSEKTTAERNTGPIVKTLLSGTSGVLAPDASGVLSPDELKVAYIDFGNVSGDLTVKDLNSGKTAKLTSHDANHKGYVYELALNPVWSPDSKWIAYTFLNDTNFSVRLAPADGGESKVLKANSEMLYGPFDWSRDGKSVLCKLQKVTEKTLALGIISIESGEVRQLLSLEWNGVGHARFSPDGKFIVYDRKEKGNRDIYVLALEGMRVSKLIDLPSSEGSPVWSADGKYVLFGSDRSGSPDLWAIGVRDGKAVDAPVLIKQGFGFHDYRITRDGRLAFTRGRMDVDCYYFNVNPATGEIIGPPRLITKSFYGQHLSPVFSPDGKKIAYTLNQNPLCIQSTTDGKEETIDTGMQYIVRLFWSPDSKSIALYGRGRTGPLGIHLFSIETRELTQIAADQAGVGEPKGFSSDGKEFLFSKGDTEARYWPFQSENVAVEIATRKERKIEFPKNFERVEDYAFSPDGRQIVYVENEQNGPEQKLVVSDIGFKEQKTIASGSGSFFYMRWSPDGKMIAYNYNEKKGKEAQGSGTELRLIAADGSWQKTPNTGKLKIVSTGTRPSWSADGTKLALTLSESASGEIGVLENFLP